MTRLALVIVAGLAALLIAAGPATASYQFQTAWGSSGSAAGQFNAPGLISVGPDGSVYVADTGNNRVQRFDANGAFLTSWGGTGAAAGQFQSPAAVAVGPDGSVYVSDSANNRMQRFDANGTFISQWGTPGAGAGQFSNPQGVAVGPDGSVYVADAGNARVEQFLADGTFNTSFGSGAGGFGQLRGIAAGPDGSVYTVDQQNSRVEHFDATGTFLGSWGTSGGGDGQFQAAIGIAASAAGVYVTDTVQNRVQKFTSAGAFVDSLDAAGSGDAAFNQPSAIAISSTGLVYVLGASRIGEYTETGGANLPPPSTGQTANAQPVNGTVKVKAPGSNQFVTLAAGQQIPIGSIVDVTKGTVDLTTTADSTTTQTARFYSGVFKLTQQKAAKPITELQLYGGNFNNACGSAKPRKASASGKRKVVRQLWGSGKGRFRTKGRYSTATIRGTQWLTQDRCDGTNVRVAAGAVVVRDLVKKVNVVVKAPKSYFAAAPGR